MWTHSLHIIVLRDRQNNRASQLIVLLFEEIFSYCWENILSDMVVEIKETSISTLRLHIIMPVFDFDLFQINAPLGFQLIANIIKYFRFYCEDCVYRSTLCMHSHFSTIRSCWMMDMASYYLAMTIMLIQMKSVRAIYHWYYAKNRIYS